MVSWLVLSTPKQSAHFLVEKWPIAHDCSWLLIPEHPAVPDLPPMKSVGSKNTKSLHEKRDKFYPGATFRVETQETHPPKKKQRPKGSLDPQKWLFWGPKHPAAPYRFIHPSIGGSKILRGESKLIITKGINQPGPFCWGHGSTDFRGAILNKELPGNFPDFPPSITFQGSQTLIFGKAILGDSKWIPWESKDH